MTHTRTSTSPDHAFSAAALEEWSGHVDAILRGISHALNNRAAALSGAIQLSRDPDSAEALPAILEPELSRVTELVAALRTFAAPRSAVEAFAPSDAAADAAAVLAFHSEQRERGATIDATATAPLRTHRWMFVRSLIALGGSTSGAPVTVRDDGDAVLVAADGAALSSSYARELATAMGGSPLSGPRAGFRIPTLESIRRREGR